MYEFVAVKRPSPATRVVSDQVIVCRQSRRQTPATRDVGHRLARQLPAATLVVAIDRKS